MGDFGKELREEHRETASRLAIDRLKVRSRLSWSVKC